MPPALDSHISTVLGNPPNQRCKPQREVRTQWHYRKQARSPEALPWSCAVSATRFEPNQEFRVTCISPIGDVVVTLHTVYVDEGYESKVPRDLWIELRGAAPSLDEAVSGFSQAALSLLSMLSFATNAAIRDPVMEPAFEDTPGVQSREFLQASVADETGIPIISRPIPVDGFVAFLEAIKAHPEIEQVHRAAGSATKRYNTGRWDTKFLLYRTFTWGSRPYKGVPPQGMPHRNIDEDGLVQSLRIQRIEFDAWVRRTLLFRNDNKSYRQAKTRATARARISRF